MLAIPSSGSAYDSFRYFSTKGVKTVPGQRALTRMPWGARSTCIDFVIERTAPLDAAYETRRATPMMASVDDELMIEPDPCLIVGDHRAAHEDTAAR
jgi:hypothetical protein